MRTRTKGIQVASDGTRTIEKQYKGQRIFARLGAVSQDDAEAELRKRQQQIDEQGRKSATVTFKVAAKKYLVECQKKGLRSIGDVAQHLELAGQWIGDFELDAIHADVLQDFIEHRQEVDEVSPTTINRTIGYISSVLLRAARVWRTDDGLPWLGTAPLLDRLDMTPRQPYPITWEEQARLFKELPAHLARMALFAVNTGLRSANVYGLRWAWERRVQGLDRSVFVIPATEFKTKRPHVAILNDVASKVLEECRGAHKDFVFTYQNELLPGKPIMPLKSMNNTAWREARKRAALPDLRVHDLRHTCAHRLRASGVSSEDRSVLMGHASSSMSEHYATPTIAHLIEMSNLANEARDAATILRVVQNSHAESHAQRKTA